MFRKQFLLCKQECSPIEGMKTVNIGDYKLHYNNDVEFTYNKTKDLKVFLVGNLFSYKNPELSNQQIVDSLAKTQTLKQFLIDVSQFYGAYVIIYKDNNNFIVFNDACAQAEIYYSQNFSAFGSQIKLLKKVINVEPHDNPKAIDYYNSKQFLEEAIYINNTTPVKNVKHLMSNHYLDVLNQKNIRFFPTVPNKKLDIDKVAVKAAIMLKGYIKAISLRHTICLPITAGYDSRVLFLASLDVKCHYFITRFSNMKDNHHDLVISKQLADSYQKTIEVIKDVEVKKVAFNSNYIDSIDYPRYSGPDLVGNKVIINGNISEIARNGFDYYNNPSARHLCYLNNKKPHSFILDEYNAWLKQNKALFKINKYHILDVFLWEEYMGILHSKSKIEANALGVTVMTPYNSRALLNLMLSTNRNDRDKFNNVLYNKIISYLSNKSEHVKSIPINPGKQREKYLLLQKYGLYKVFNFVKIRIKTNYLYQMLITK